MRKFAVTLLYIALAICPVVTIGCSGSSATVDAVSTIDEDGLADARSGLVEMAEMFKFFNGESIKPPKKAAEFSKYDGLFPVAGVLLPAGKIVHAGGTLSKDPPAKVLGYAKDVPTSGGWVLLTDGEVKEVTAAEYAELSKTSK